MASLSAAHHGYRHQDVVGAYALASLLLADTEDRAVAIEQRTVDRDLFDDMELVGKTRKRIQVKAHTAETRRLNLNDLITQGINFRIDDVLRSVVNDPNPADEYRLFTTDIGLGEELLGFVQSAATLSSLLPDLVTQRFRLDSDRIWPVGQQPVWLHVEEFSREAFCRFCRVFVIEIGCPRSSGDLRNPGPFERALLDLLRNRIGVGIWPNNNRDVADAAAHLIYSAGAARARNESKGQNDVMDILGLRIDYGRVQEHLAIDEHRVVQRADILDELLTALACFSRLAVVGSPGIGKSWLLHQLAEKLIRDGWIVAVHYCFIDLLDIDRERRVTIETTFGSIVAELLDADPSLAKYAEPRFAAGHHQLEQLLEAAVQEKPDRRIAIIVDGLDHIDRQSGRSSIGAGAMITEELANVKLPPGATVIVGSQPGDHLASLLEASYEYNLRRWPGEQIRVLVERMDFLDVLRLAGLDNDDACLLEVIVNKANGNPLYATYLARTAISVARQDPGAPRTADISGYLGMVPEFDEDLNAYYRWLVEGLERDKGVLWVAELLSMLDFPVSVEEIRQVCPQFGHHVAEVVSHLAPVLVKDISRGGVRIYHESFQRYMNDRLDSDSSFDISAMLSPVIDWLADRGFFADTRAFRSLLGLLHKTGQNDRVFSYITDDFVARAVAHGQPADAVLSNIVVAAICAASIKLWPALTRLIEICRAADYFYRWRIVDHTMAEAYGRTLRARHGAGFLADRLLHDGHCAFPARPGLVLCRLCDEHNVTAPWKEYIRAYELERASDNTLYEPESDAAIRVALLRGRLRLLTREQSIEYCVSCLHSQDEQSVHPADVAHELGAIYGSESIRALIECLPSGTTRAWVRLASARISDEPVEARVQANSAISEGLPSEGWRACLRLGADPQLFPRDTKKLGDLTTKVIAPEVQYEEGVLAAWLSELELAAALGDENALLRTEAGIPIDTWFRRWLRFCIVLVHPRSTSDHIVFSLSELSRDIEVFEGRPRVCDLHGLHGEIQASFKRALGQFDDEQWQESINALANISAGTSTWLVGSRTGPLPLDALFELCLATARTNAKSIAASNLGRKLLAPDHRKGEFYDTHAQDSLLLARIHAYSGQRDLAEEAWLEACRFLSSYGWRKDITVYELLDPLSTLAIADSVRTRQCLSKVQPIVEGVLVHTDGKETSHAIHEWLDLAAEIHPAGALSYVGCSEIGRVPGFGGFDHVLSKALRRLGSQLDPWINVAGWLASGCEARFEIAAALDACERLAKDDDESGRLAWAAVVASLDGDGVAPPSELPDLASKSAERMGISSPSIEMSGREHQDTGEEEPMLRRGFDPYVLPVFPLSASPMQIANGVRKWRESPDYRTNLDRVTNAVGWRLLEMIDANDETAAESVVRRIARDTPGWDKNTILPGLAEGLAFRGAVRLAAIASAYAYTRTNDGWRRFAGANAESFFRMALSLDASVAWSILAEEVLDGVRSGGEYGITGHLIELLATNDRVQDAFAAWESAFDAVLFRLPSTGRQDDLEVLYDSDCEDLPGMLALVIIARINRCLLHEKRLAVAAAALVVHYSPKSFSSAFRIAVLHGISSSTLIAVLQALECFETEPYEATLAVESELRAVAAGQLVCARVLALQLLERAGKRVSIPPPLDLPVIPAIPTDRVIELISKTGSNRTNSVKEIWPEFPKHVAGLIDVSLKSEGLRKQMQSALERVRNDRKGSRLELWLPVDEEVECIVQKTGASVRLALAQEGILDPCVESEVAERLLGDMEISVRLSLSRIVRPKQVPSSYSLASGWLVSEPIRKRDGEFLDWVLLAHYERELVVGSGYDKPVTETIETFSGLLCGPQGRHDQDLPFGYGDSSGWCLNAPVLDPPDSFRGPLAGFEIVRDSFGPVELLMPNPVVTSVGQLSVAPFHCGLTLIDSEGGSAVVCRAWRQKFIDERDLADREPILKGLCLLVRPDIFNEVAALASEPVQYASFVRRSHANQDQP